MTIYTILLLLAQPMVYIPLAIVAALLVCVWLYARATSSSPAAHQPVSSQAKAVHTPSELLRAMINSVNSSIENDKKTLEGLKPKFDGTFPGNATSKIELFRCQISDSLVRFPKMVEAWLTTPLKANDNNLFISNLFEKIVVFQFYVQHSHQMVLGENIVHQVENLVGAIKQTQNSDKDKEYKEYKKYIKENKKNYLLPTIEALFNSYTDQCDRYIGMLRALQLESITHALKERMLTDEKSQSHTYLTKDRLQQIDATLIDVFNQSFDPNSPKDYKSECYGLDPKVVTDIVGKVVLEINQCEKMKRVFSSKSDEKLPVPDRVANTLLMPIYEKICGATLEKFQSICQKSNFKRDDFKAAWDEYVKCLKKLKNACGALEKMIDKAQQQETINAIFSQLFKNTRTCMQNSYIYPFKNDLGQPSFNTVASRILSQANCIQPQGNLLAEFKVWKNSFDDIKKCSNMLDQLNTGLSSDSKSAVR